VKRFLEDWLFTVGMVLWIAASIVAIAYLWSKP
jgi:hypothetical protein